MKQLAILLAMVVSGCSDGTDGGGPCADLCRVLVGDCGYAAFPDMGSCLDGCAYEASEGQDVVGQVACVEAASCDTFAILECENEFGS